jgi:hypothetical protein
VPVRGSPGEPKGAGTARPAPADPRGERGEKD